VYLAQWASCQDRLGQAVAAQLGYAHNEEGRFVGLKGRRRLAVIDGLVSRPVLEALAEDLPEGATMEVVGRAIADDAAEAARELAKGSKVRKIPGELLLGWRRTEGGRS
jgi:adenine-specific DNA-methyltransferase